MFVRLYHVTVTSNDSIAIRKPAYGSKNVMGMKLDELYSKYDGKTVDKCS